MKKTEKPFVFNDENLANLYGFYVLTGGIDLKRFKKNPVMLDNHRNSNDTVLGKWKDVKKDEGILTGLPVFDNNDPDVEKIAGKVERGVIKGCSMGLSFNHADFKQDGDKLILTKCELLEVSITPVPAQANSVHLYASDTGEKLSDEDIKTICLNAKSSTLNHNNENDNQNSTNMSKITLTVAAAAVFGLSATTEIEADELSQKIVALDAEKKAAELKLSTIQSQKEAENLQRITGKVEAALKTGKIEAPQKEEFINLGIANEALLDTTLGSIPAKRDLSGTIGNPGVADVKTQEDFVKLSLDQQLQYKQNQPDAYRKLFAQS